MKRIYIIIGIVAACLLLAGGLIYWKFRTSPAYSLLQLKSAIETRNYAEFEKYVDVDQTMTSLIDQALEIFKGNSGDNGSSTWSYFGSSFMDMVKPQLMALYKPQIQKWVEGGKFATENPFSGDIPNPIPDLWKSKGFMKVDGIAYQKKEGNTALVGIAIKPSQFDTVLVIDIKMNKKGSHWRISGVSGLPEFQNAMDNLEQKRVDALNQPIREEMARNLRISSFDKIKVDDPRRIKTKILIGIENIGNRTIHEYTIVLGFSDSHHNLKKEIRLNTTLDNQASQNLAPHATETLFWPSNGNMPLDSWLYETPLTNMSVNLTVESIVFSDGSALQLHEKWKMD